LAQRKPDINRANGIKKNNRGWMQAGTVLSVIC